MKSIRKLLPAMLAAGAVLAGAAGMSAAIAADEATSPAPPAPGAHGWHHHRGPWHLLGKLGLSAAQKEQIKGIFAAARPQMQSLRGEMQTNMQKLHQTLPTDPNYTTIASQVSQTHGSLAAQALTQRALVRAQVFKVLTPAQQAQLSTLESQMAAHRHGPRGGPNAGATPPSE
ncbi:MAG: Spy/CpxP family protein refolding chaperone [Steroidobacteraceae bacterium]